MLSYEDIFMRHHPRPLSFLSGSLDSPPLIRRHTPVLRAFTLPKERRPRPISICTLESIPRHFSNNYKLPNDDCRLSNDRYKLPDDCCKLSNDRCKLSNNRCNLSNDRYKLPKDSCKLPKDSCKLLKDSCKLSNSRYKLPNDSYKFSDDSYKPSSDNYKLSTTFADRSFSRRAIPLCTPDELLDIIREPSGYYALPTDPWNEVYPDIYLSDAPTALCTSVLKRLGVTHVLNAAQGKEKGCGQVNTTPGFYSMSDIEFLGVPAFDNVVFRIYPYFDEAAQFIEDGLASKGKVLVHCRAGISRSATLVCAFLMLKRGLTVQEAVRAVRKNRAIIPNDGFLQQLCDLNDKLKRKSKI